MLVVVVVVLVGGTAPAGGVIPGGGVIPAGGVIPGGGPPAGGLPDGGAEDVAVADTTVKDAVELVTPDDRLAVMLVVPAATAVARPVGSIVAIVVSELAHVT